MSGPIVLQRCMSSKEHQAEKHQSTKAIIKPHSKTACRAARRGYQAWSVPGPAVPVTYRRFSLSCPPQIKDIIALELGIRNTSQRGQRLLRLHLSSEPLENTSLSAGSDEAVHFDKDEALQARERFGSRASRRSALTRAWCSRCLHCFRCPKENQRSHRWPVDGKDPILQRSNPGDSSP